MGKTYKDNLYINGEKHIVRRKSRFRLLKKFSKKKIRKIDDITNGNEYRKYHDKWIYD